MTDNSEARIKYLEACKKSTLDNYEGELRSLETREKTRLERMETDAETKIVQITNRIDRQTKEIQFLQERIDELQNQRREIGIKLDKAKELVLRKNTNRKAILKFQFEKAMSYYDSEFNRLTKEEESDSKKLSES